MNDSIKQWKYYNIYKNVPIIVENPELTLVNIKIIIEIIIIDKSISHI